MQTSFGRQPAAKSESVAVVPEETATYAASIRWTSSINSKSNRPDRAAIVNGLMAEAPAITHNSAQTSQPLSPISTRAGSAFPRSIPWPVTRSQ
jgi:hypothetical protein